MHVARSSIFEGPPPQDEDFLEHVHGRLSLVPRFRQKLAIPPVETGQASGGQHDLQPDLPRPHSGLPSRHRGGAERLAGQMFSRLLDRSKPLWELWLVQGLERNRFAILNKTHHALVDGVSGVDIGSVLFDVEPVPEPAPVDDDWAPRPSRAAPSCGARGARPRRRPRRLIERAVEAARPPGAAAIAWSKRSKRSARSPAPSQPRPGRAAEQSIGPHRRFVWARGSWRPSSGSRTRSAAPSTTSCLRS